MGELSSAAARDAHLSSLMVAAQDGDKLAYAALLRACIPFIERVARGTGVPADSVDDVVQEVLLAVHSARHTYDSARPFLPWLRVIAQRRAIDSFRVRSRQQSREVNDPLSYEAHPDPAVPADHLIGQAEQAAWVMGAVAALPDRQREAMQHLASQGLTHDEAAAWTGRTKGALKVSLHRALRSLRSRFAKEDCNS